MPISQDRLIALINITDSVLTLVERQRASVTIEVRAAIDAFYAGTASHRTALASELLSRLQAVEAIVSAPILSGEAIATLAREREHFRITSKRNALVARGMRRSRLRSAQHTQNTGETL